MILWESILKISTKVKKKKPLDKMKTGASVRDGINALQDLTFYKKLNNFSFFFITCTY